MNLAYVTSKTLPTVCHCFWIMINLSAILWLLLNSTNFKLHLFQAKCIIFFTSLTRCSALEFSKSVMALPSSGVTLDSFFLPPFLFLVISTLSVLLTSKCSSLQVGLALCAPRCGVQSTCQVLIRGRSWSRPSEGSLVVDSIPTIVYAKRWDRSPGKEAKVGQSACQAGSSWIPL